MTPEEKEAWQYRFSGFNFPMIQLDSTGPSFIQTGVHPYFYDQPVYWAKPFFVGPQSGGMKMTEAESQLLLPY